MHLRFPIVANEGDILSNNVSQDTRINGLLTNNSIGLDAITFHLIGILHILFRQVKDFILIIFQDKTMTFKLMVLSIDAFEFQLLQMKVIYYQTM